MSEVYSHLPLRVSEPEDRYSSNGAIMIYDSANNDIAEFIHSDYTTVGQTYEQALFLANILVQSANSSVKSAL